MKSFFDVLCVCIVCMYCVYVLCVCIVCHCARQNGCVLCNCVTFTENNRRFGIHIRIAQKKNDLYIIRLFDSNYYCTLFDEHPKLVTP